MRTTIALLLGSLLLIAGCGDDDPPCVGCPVWPFPPRANLENIWPNADLTTWDYAFELRRWGTMEDLVLYENEEDVPPASRPSWNDVREILGSRPVTANDVVTTIYGSYHLKFDGTRQTTGGTAQNLIEWHVIEDTLTFPPQAAPVMPLRIATDMPRGPQFIGNPVFIQGGAWMKTGNRIIKYGDIGAGPSWQFLTEDLDPGDEFEFQLGAGLIDGVYLYCRVDKEMTVENQAGRFAKAIDCLYIIDYGVSRLTDVQGNPIGYFRNVDIGRVIYAPTVGPVLCYERLGIQPEEKSSLGLADVTVDLYDSSTLE